MTRKVKTGAAKFDVYAHVTDQIVAQIEAGAPPWRKPWTGGVAAGLPMRFNGDAYRGINVLVLWATAQARGYGCDRWMTYRQAQELGGQVRKGETSATTVKFGTIERETEDGDAAKIPYARAYRVFNADQIDGLPEGFYARPDPAEDLGTEAVPALEAFFVATGARIASTPTPRAYYSPGEDRVHMPPIATFYDAARFYGVLSHEVAHWTGHARRLDRLKRFADRRAYAFEELVAEMAACMVSVRLGVEPDFGQSAAYIEGWTKALKGDSRAIFKAAAEAQKAVDFIFAEAEKEAGPVDAIEVGVA